MKLLLFGGDGQLGFEIMKRANDLNFEVIAPVISELDITNREQVLYLADATKPQVVLNCAAYTQVDQAETEKDLAFKVNRDGAGHIAEAASNLGVRLLHVSTDYVFNGKATSPISEEQKTDPINVYGESKLAGELEVARIMGSLGVIVRTSSLHGAKGLNFVHTMLKLFREKKELKIVNDQIMSPTYAGWLAEVLLDLVRSDCYGILHACCAGAISWYEFACGIYEQTKSSLENEVELIPVAAVEFPRPAKRPNYSVMDCSRLSAVLGRSPISWQEGLARHLAEIE